MKKNTRFSQGLLQPPAWLYPLLSVFFFFATGLCVQDSTKRIVLLCVLVALVTGVVFFRQVRERISLPIITLSLFVLIGGISTFYALSGKFALSEFLKLLMSFCLALLMTAGIGGDSVTAGRKAAAILTRSVAVFSFLSIDLLSTRIFSGLAQQIFGLFTPHYDSLAGVESGVRMISFFSDPNPFAGCVGICVLLSLGLVMSSENEKERIGHLVCLFVNSLAFVLAFSMGAIAFIAVAFVAYLFLECKNRRSALFILMAETLLLVLGATALIALTSLTTWDGFQPIPVLCVAIGSAAFVLLDRYVGRNLSAKLESHSSAVTIAICVALAALAAFAVLAYSITGSIDMASGESVRRSIYPAPGEYTLSIEATGPVSVTVETQNEIDTMMHTSTSLYKGDANNAVFTVPDDSVVVYLTFTASAPVTIDRATCNSINVPLEYKLLPDFIANRLQGLWANQNAIQRTVFFNDGMKLFARSPIFGLGLGSYENGIKSVQSFYYETKYAHNHYIQTLTETGVVGLLLFLGVLVSCGAAVFVQLRREDSRTSLVPALAAALLFMAGHAFVEVDFSYYAFLPVAFGVFAIINLTCGNALSMPWLTQKVKTAVSASCALLVLVFAGFLLSNMSASRLVQNTPTFSNMERAAAMDAFEKNDYMLSYVASASSAADNPEIQEKARKYADILSTEDSNTIPIYLAEYYFGIGEPDLGFAMLEKYAGYVSSDQKAWDQIFNVLIVNAEDSDEFCAGVRRIVDLMNDWNRNNLGEVTLSEYAQKLLTILEIE